MAPPGPLTRRSRRGELPQPLALKYFTRGALLEALEARGWRQFPASGLHTWVYYTPEGLARRANKEPTAHNVDFVLDDHELYAYVELHGILDELVRDKEAAEAAEASEAEASVTPDINDSVGASAGSPLWLNPSTPPPLQPGDGSAVSSAQSAESEREDVGFIPTSDDDEDEAPDGRQDSAIPPVASRKRPRLRTSRSTGEKRPQQRRSSASTPRASTVAARRSSNSQGRSPTPRSSSNPPVISDDGDNDETVARIDREYAAGKRELRDLELELEALERRVKKKRFYVHKLMIERDCQRERQRKLRELKEQFYGSAVKKKPGISDCD